MARTTTKGDRQKRFATARDRAIGKRQQKLQNDASEAITGDDKCWLRYAVGFIEAEERNKRDRRSAKKAKLEMFEGLEDYLLDQKLGTVEEEVYWDYWYREQLADLDDFFSEEMSDADSVETCSCPGACAYTEWLTHPTRGDIIYLEDYDVQPSHVPVWTGSGTCAFILGPGMPLSSVFGESAEWANRGYSVKSRP